MAERTVNVNINYNVKTVEIEKLAQASMRAQQATDRLQQSSQKFSQQSTTGNRATSQSIEAMRVQMQRLKTQIDVTNQSDTKRLASLTTQYKGLKKQIDDFNKSLNETKKQTQQTNSQFGSLLNTVKAVFTVAVARQVVDMTLQMARLSGNVEGVERAFRRTFVDADLLINNLRRSTHGAISDFELMQRTLLAKNLGVEVSELGTILEFVATRAQQTGQNLDVLLEKFIRGIGVKSPRLLDDLGISSIRLKENLDGVALSAISIGDFTRKVSAIAKEELDEMGGFAETAATKVDQIGVAWERVRIALAKRLTNTQVLQFFENILKGGEALIKAFDLSAPISGTIQALKNLAVAEEVQKQALEETERITKNLQGTELERFDVVQQGINSNVQTIGRYNDEIRKLQRTADQTKGFGFPGFSKENIEGAKRFNELQKKFGSESVEIFKREAENAQQAIAHYEFRKLVIEETIRLLAQYRDGIKEINDGEGKEQLGLIQEVEKKIADLNEKIQKSRNETFIAEWNKQLEILKGRLSDLKKLGLPEFKSPETFEKISKTFEEKIKKNAEETTQEFLKMEDVISRIDASLRNFPKDPIPTPETPFQPDFLFELGESIIENQEQLIQESIDITTGYLNDIAFAEVEAYNVRIDNLRSFFDEQILLAGDNERAKQELRVKEQRQIDELRRQQAVKEKQARRFSVIVDTAASISKTAAQLGFPAALPFIALAIAQGALQLSAINRAQPRGFKKGGLIEGPGTTTSDSIPIMASNKEFMVNAEATRNSMQLLEAVNAKKIDDRILKDIRQTSQPGVKMVQMDHRPIVEAIEKQKYPDLVRDGNIIWEAKRIGNIHKRYVRSKAMSK